MAEISQKITKIWKIKYFLSDKDTGKGYWNPTLSSGREYKIYGNTKYERTKCGLIMIEGFIEKYLKPNQELENALICEVGFNGEKIGHYDKNSRSIMYH